MARQMFIHEALSSQTKLNDKQSPQIKILNWNIRNPSIKRAKEQSNWLIQTGANVIILTEVKDSEGGRFICDWLESHSFNVFFTQPINSDYCALIATKDFASKKLELGIDFLPHRAVSVMSDVCVSPLKRLNIIGFYVPSRGSRNRRNVDKREFQYQIIDLISLSFKKFPTSNLIVGGDLNVLERNHFPHYSVFGEWEYEFYEAFLKSGFVDAYRLLHPNSQEYSWFGKKGNGYRFDHFFVSREISQYIKDCSYLHITRNLGLSDHSAMLLEADFSG